MNAFSKIELLYMINELQDLGVDNHSEDLRKVQRIFLNAIEADRELGAYSVDVLVGRQEKKTLTKVSKVIKQLGEKQ